MSRSPATRRSRPERAGEPSLWRDLVDHTRAAVVAACNCRTVEGASAAENEATIGIQCGLALEDVEQTVGPASILIGRKLENRAAILGSAVNGRAVEVARRIEDQARKGGLCGLTSEEMQHVLRPASIGIRRQLENHATTPGSTGLIASSHGRAIQISCRIEDEAGRGTFSVAAFERVQHALRPASIGIRRQLENRARAMS